MIDAIQLLYVIVILGSAILAGWRLAPYIVRVYSRAPGRLDRLFNPIENGIYRLTGVNTDHSMGWKEYFFAALFVNIVQMVIAFTIAALLIAAGMPLGKLGLLAGIVLADHVCSIDRAARGRFVDAFET